MDRSSPLPMNIVDRVVRDDAGRRVVHPRPTATRRMVTDVR